MSERNVVRVSVSEREFVTTNGGCLVADGEKSVIVIIPKTLSPWKSKSGKAMLFASTAGAIPVAGNLRVAVNMYQPLKAKGTKEAPDHAAGMDVEDLGL